LHGISGVVYTAPGTDFTARMAGHLLIGMAAPLLLVWQTGPG
jgi:cytochrome c oxidase assembly factor CtaG